MVCTIPLECYYFENGLTGTSSILQMSLEKMFLRRMAHPSLCFGE